MGRGRRGAGEGGVVSEGRWMEGKRSQKSLVQSKSCDCEAELHMYVRTYVQAPHTHTEPTPDTLLATHVA